jgi:hypothetical protein
VLSWTWDGGWGAISDLYFWDSRHGPLILAVVRNRGYNSDKSQAQFALTLTAASKTSGKVFDSA